MPAKSSSSSGAQGVNGKENETRVDNVVPLSVFFLRHQEKDGGGDGGVKIQSDKLPNIGCKTKKKRGGKLKKTGSARTADSTHAGTDQSVDSSMDGSGDKVSEGMTTTASVATTPVPIGRPLRRVSSKKRKKKDQKKWAERLMSIGQ